MDDAAIPAATLILVRDQPGGAPELLMVERARGMAFAAGAMVFPGGRIDEHDRAIAASLGTSPEAIAAVRETIEETAIPAALSPVPDAMTSRGLQQSLLADMPFGELLESAGLRIDHSALVPFARWVPNFHAVRRFDTLFFVACAPAGEWRPQVVSGECAGASWITAAEVLRRDAAGQASLIFPTRRTLERLAQHGNFDAIAADARAHPIEPITPWVEEHEGERFITISANLGFPVTQEKLDGLWRG